jgi:hypothetical protein
MSEQEDFDPRPAEIFQTQATISATSSLAGKQPDLRLALHLYCHTVPKGVGCLGGIGAIFTLGKSPLLASEIWGMAMMPAPMAAAAERRSMLIDTEVAPCIRMHWSLPCHGGPSRPCTGGVELFF